MSSDQACSPLNYMQSDAFPYPGHFSPVPDLCHERTPFRIAHIKRIRSLECSLFPFVKNAKRQDMMLVHADNPARRLLNFLDKPVCVYFLRKRHGLSIPLSATQR